MKKYNIAIFENEKVEVEGVFEYINISEKFDGGVNCKYFARSQDLPNLSELHNYDLVIMDVDLSSKSELDGYTLIKKIEEKLNPIPKILIMTGHNIKEGYNEEYGINAHPFIEKPLSFVSLINKLKEII